MVPLRTQLALTASHPGLLEDLRDIWGLAAQRSLSKAEGADSGWGWDLQQSCSHPRTAPVPSGHRQRGVPGSQVLQWAENSPRAKGGGDQMMEPPQAHPWALAGALLSTARTA